MKQFLGIAFILMLLPQVAISQQGLTEEQLKAWKEENKEAQRDLDVNHGGVGFSLSKPYLAEGMTTAKPWFGVDILSDIIHVKFAMGQCFVPGKEYIGDRNFFGTQMSAGLIYPLKFLSFGNQYTYDKVFRGHPIIGGDLGMYNFRLKDAPGGDPLFRLFYLGVNPGYRIRFPYGSIDFNLNLYGGFRFGTSYDNFNAFGWNPTVTLRLDALKWRYDPDLVTVDGTFSSIQNFKKGETRIVGSHYDQYTGSVTTEYETDYSYDVNVQNMSFGVQDIGSHFGIGPKISYMNPKRTYFVPASYLFGIVGEGRWSYLDYGVTLEGGKIGHGGKLEVKDESEGKYRRRLVSSFDQGYGTINTVNLYVNYGLDISPLIVGLMGYSIDKGDATSFFTTTAGFISGIHASFGQQFSDPSDVAYYDMIMSMNQNNAKEKFLNPAKIGPGFLGGFYFSFQVGALSVKFTNYRYYGSPFASNSLISVAYRIPKDMSWTFN